MRTMIEVPILGSDGKLLEHLPAKWNALVGFC